MQQFMFSPFLCAHIQEFLSSRCLGMDFWVSEHKHLQLDWAALTSFQSTWTNFHSHQLLARVLLYITHLHQHMLPIFIILQNKGQNDILLYPPLYIKLSTEQMHSKNPSVAWFWRIYSIKLNTILYLNIQLLFPHIGESFAFKKN